MQHTCAGVRLMVVSGCQAVAQCSRLGADDGFKSEVQHSGLALG